MFLLVNMDFLNLEEMLIEPEKATLPVEIELPWKMFKYDHLQENEKIFKYNFLKKFGLENKKNVYTTFRGEKGLVNMARAYFVPKKG